eukprot:TRINITY_DN2429_c0_g1_i1.p1 TRINITY_DN2429_c0_g1~~TRINITY_DN2429_c0_g1_i1.p1  ORF type:complete len:125 (-),score=33.48 TRINITY_DN2429_c0_g1_i1:62-400(-)
MAKTGGLWSKMFQPIEATFGERYRAACGHRKLGLLWHDVIAETPNVALAISRLPDDVKIARDRRIKTAFDLDTKGKYLPEEMWTKPEEDVLYLAKYIQEVEAEQAARTQWRL